VIPIRHLDRLTAPLANPYGLLDRTPLDLLGLARS